MKKAVLTTLRIVLGLLVLIPSFAFAKDPDCAGFTRWATQVAFASLKNAGITNNEKVHFAKTRTVRIASQRIGKDLHRQVHRITFTEISGNKIDVITVNDASSQECSMSGVDVYVIAKHLGP